MISRLLPFAVWASFALLLAACNSLAPKTSDEASSKPSTQASQATAQTAAPMNQANASAIAAVEDVSVSGDPGRYQFAVTIRSDETGCDQYADWWEVVSESGDLLYRRILAHSHVDEQPFARSGGTCRHSAW